MSLTLATLVCAILALMAGLALFLNSSGTRAACRSFPRSEMAGWVLMAVAAGWFLFHVSRLSEADFGNFSGILMMGFGTLAVLSCWYAKDFLSVRAACILYLLFANVILGAAYFQEPGSRLLVVGPIYLGIVAALYLTISPFRLRDFFTWLHQDPVRAKVVGGVLAAYGVVLFILPLTY